MKFTAATVLAAAVGASASWAGNVTVTTEVVDVYTTYCPGPTQITHGSKTYTVTEATTLTITDCPCTVTKPVTTTSAVVCDDCDTPVFTNSTMATVPVTVSAPATGSASPTGPAVTTEVVGPSATPSTVTGGAGKAAAFSGAGLAGVVGLAAFIL